jgi:hypothetical protein
MAELVLVTGGSGYVAGWCIAESRPSPAPCRPWPTRRAD